MKKLLLLPLFLRTALAALEPDSATPPEAAPTPEQLDFFEKKIRPVLADKCYKCHSEKSEKVKGGLLLDTREGTRRGGDNGPAVVPGQIEDSLLIEAVRYTSKDFAMPPEKAGGKLPDAIVKDFETWVKMGAPDPRDGAAKVVKKYDTEEAKKWWAFQPVQKPAAPEVKDTAWPRGEIDKFVLAGLEARGLKPVGDADKATLLRRIYFDLVGLPPTPQQIAEFMKDASPEAYAKVVDRLLASPQYGERWGRHWLDVARYAESSGKDVNITFPNAWRYRDYVIAAFNADKPYDQFLREQIAGDLLPAKDDRERAGNLTATGFLAIGSKSLNEQNPRQFCLDLADEQIDSLSQAMLGLTIACARCHDHKFDPIPQREYYALAGIFLSTETHYGTSENAQNRHASTFIDLPKSSGLPTLGMPLAAADRARKEKQLADLREEQRGLIAERFAQRNGGGNAAPADAPATPQRPGRPNNQLRPLIVRAQIGELELELKSYDEYGQPKAQAMGVLDLPATRPRPGFGPGGGGPGGMARERIRQRLGGRPPEFLAIGNTALYARGDVDKPGEKVPRGFPAIHTTTTPPTIPPGTSGRRELADWITGPQNPLTARVFANRTWHWLFGQGIVESVDNFGTSGKKPTNQALLDHLATRLVENGWSMKKTIREIVLSHAYQLASTHNEKAFAADPENTLVWRMSQRRLDAECVRDAMLAAGSTLDLAPPVGSLIATAGNVVLGGPRRFSAISEDAIINAGGDRRSIYLPIAREVVPDSLAVFDFADTSLVTGARETTNVPSQALYMLNSPFVTAQARKLAERVLAAYPAGPNGGASANLDDRVKWAYWLTVGHAPDHVERQAAANFFAKFPANSAKGESRSTGLRDAEDVKAAWTSFCRALFASAEFRYLN